MSVEEIRKVNKGHGIDSVTYLGDDLWTNAREI
jgi:predicted ribosome-associated RNA-binding protein Tma20